MKRFFALAAAVVVMASPLFAKPVAEDQVIVINPIEVPEGRAAEALEIWDRFAAYFREQPGYVGTTLHESIAPDSKFHYVNVAVWESAEAFMTALQSEELKEIGDGFPEDMPHYPSLYRIVRK